MSSVIQGILGALLSFLGDWLGKEKAVADAYEARSRKAELDSIKEGIATERRMEKAVDAVQPVLSPSDWRNRALLLACALSLTGCFRFHVYHAAYRPVPPAIEAVDPPAPTEEDLLRQLEAVRTGQEVPFSSREVSIFTYAAKLERAYTLTRQDAIQANDKSGYPRLGDSDQP